MQLLESLPRHVPTEVEVAGGVEENYISGGVEGGQGRLVCVCGGGEGGACVCGMCVCVCGMCACVCVFVCVP